MQCLYQKNHVEIYRINKNLFFRKGSLALRKQCNGAYLISEGIVGAVDVPSAEAAAEMREEALMLFGQPIRYIFLTHGHHDHVRGLPAMLEQPVTVFCSDSLIDQVKPEGVQSNTLFAGVKNTMRLVMGNLEIQLIKPEGVMHSPHDMFINIPGE